MSYEDYELEQRRTEYLLEKGDRELKIQQEDEVLYGTVDFIANDLKEYQPLQWIG